jgi:hypothetical protein
MVSSIPSQETIYASSTFFNIAVGEGMTCRWDNKGSQLQCAGSNAFDRLGVGVGAACLPTSPAWRCVEGLPAF